jgi:hypothetical protein
MFAGRREVFREGIVKVVELYCSSPSVRGACWDDLVEKWAPMTQLGVQFLFDKRRT